MGEPIDAGETILVVDDDPNVRTLMSALLRRHQYHVLEAADGRDALAVAGEHAAPIHLIVSDVNMPKMGGWMLLDRLRAWYPGIRFLLVSGYDQPTDVLSGVAETPTGFLAKPFTAQEFCEAVRELLDRPSQRRTTS